MRRLINFLSLLAGLLTSLAIICTLLTTYQFLYVGQIFNSYFPIQIGILVTMILWAIKFYFFEKGARKNIYAIFCIAIAICSLFFIGMNVK